MLGESFLCFLAVQADVPIHRFSKAGEAFVTIRSPGLEAEHTDQVSDNTANMSNPIRDMSLITF